MILTAFPAAMRRVSAAALCLGWAAALGGCSPYPDDGEFLAGVVYAANFLTGVKTLAQLPAVGRGVGPNGTVSPYTLIATTSGADTAKKITATATATSPFWNLGDYSDPNNVKLLPIARSSAPPVYVLDSTCTGPQDYHYDERLDLIRLDRQYPLFPDLPELLTANTGKAGRTGTYSAVVEVIHLTAPGDFPCQSIKRLDTAQSRVGKDLQEGRHEYRLYQVFDPALDLPPLPVQLGFFNQLVLPYIDMGPVPLEPDGNSFRTMPVIKVSTAAGKLISTVILGNADEAGPSYSPICRDFTLTAATPPPPDANDPAYKAVKQTNNLSSCLVCQTLDAAGNLNCPYAHSQETP